MRVIFVFLLFWMPHLAAYTPVIMPNGSTLPWTMEDGVKVFHLVAEPVHQEFAPDVWIDCWGYNGQTPGPVIEAVEGDRVRILVTNHLPEPTTVHWHGLILPNGMDGVTGLNQAPIPPGETFKYEFTLVQNGTYMYHPHFDEMTEIGMGLMGFFIIHPKKEEEPRIDRDYVIMLHEWFIPPGATTPDSSVMLDFNYFTFNGTVWPTTEPMLAQLNERVRVRIGNLSMDSHPIHFHGHTFTVTGTGAGKIPSSAQYEDVTVNVAVGSVRDIEFIANNPGDWAFHCHKTHHLMNAMGHGTPNMLGVNLQHVEERLRKLIPGYMSMGETGMGEMFDEHHQHMPRPPNFSRLGSPGQFGTIDMSGMFTVVKIREKIEDNQDPGWYENPEGTVASPVRGCQD